MALAPEKLVVADPACEADSPVSADPAEGRREITETEFVRYIDRTREYYRAQDYERPYRWPRFGQVPFTPLAKPLSECTVTLITTANEVRETVATGAVAAGAEAAGAVATGAAKRRVYSVLTGEPPERFDTSGLSWHKEATHTDDLGSFFPLKALLELARDGRIGGVAERCHGVPTRYSQRRTETEDAPQILERCRQDEVDVALLVPL